MISGVHLASIESTDLYRRFLILKLLLKKAKSQTQIDETQSSRRYAEISRDLQGLEDVIAIKNNNSNAKAYEATLRIDDLLSQLNEIIPKVQVRKDAYEGDLLKRWRNILTQKKKNEEESKKLKDEKSTSNKNLMYLSSELMKKQRISTHNVNSHRQRIEQIQNKIEAVIKEANIEFQEKHANLRQMIEAQQKRVLGLIESYKEQLQAEKQQFLQEAKEKTQGLQQQLAAENKAFMSNAEGLKEILLKLENRSRLL